MKTIKKKTYFPFMTGTPRTMTPMEQVLCMVWLAQNHTLEELRERQSIIEAQQQMAYEHNRPADCIDDLAMMSDNTAAAVAYQTFPELDTWIAFIKA